MMSLTMADGEDVVPPVMEALENHDLPLRGRLDLIEVLRRMHLTKQDDRISAGLIARIHDREGEIRISAVRALEDVGQESDIPSLLARLEVEENQPAVAALLKTIMSLGDWHIGYNGYRHWIHGGERLSPLERRNLERRVEELYSKGQPGPLREIAEEFLEHLAAQRMQRALAHTLAARLDSAEHFYLEALDLKPDSRYVIMRYGKFLTLERGDPAGLKILEENGMALRIPRLSALPTIDGRIDEKVWQEAVLIDSFYKNMRAMRLQSGSFRTEVRLGYADHSFFGCAKIFVDDIENLSTHYRDRDSHVWNDDSFGISFIVDPQQVMKRHAIVFTPIGTILDVKMGGENNRDESWSGIRQAKSHVDADSWSVEFEMTLDPDWGVEKGAGWLAQIKTGRTGISEHVSWNPAHGSDPIDQNGLFVFD